MIAFLTVIHVIVCVFLILVVLLQQGKGQDIGSAFGGGGTQATFGSRGGASLLSKLTTVAAAMFMLTSLTLTIMISQPGADSVIDDNAVTTPATPPAVAEPEGVQELDVQVLDGADEAAAPEETAPETDDGVLAPAVEPEPEN